MKRPNDLVMGGEPEVQAWMEPTHIDDQVFGQHSNCGLQAGLLGSIVFCLSETREEDRTLEKGKQDWKSFDVCSLGRRSDSLQVQVLHCSWLTRPVPRCWAHPRHTASRPRRVTTFWIPTLSPSTSLSQPWGSVSLLAWVVCSPSH